MAELKADGLTNRDICRAVGIHEATLYRWLNRPSSKLHRALGESLKKAEADYKRTLLTTIREAALRKNGQWTAAAWLLERKYPDEYAQTARDRAERAEAAPQIVLGVAVGVAKAEPDDEDAPEGDGEGGDADG
nr:MAG TPA: putative terminase small subunit [Caudoviricetes sp.]